MTATTTHPLLTPVGTADTPDPAAPHPAASDPGERGRLRIDPSVLRKVAEHIADLTTGTVPAPRTVAGLGLGRTGATAKVTVSAQRVDLRLELALCYPGLLRSTVDRLRGRVGDELRRITGYEVRSIAVTVTALLPESSSRLH